MLLTNKVIHWRKTSETFKRVIRVQGDDNKPCKERPEGKI